MSRDVRRIRGFSGDSDSSIGKRRKPTSGLYKSTSCVSIAARPHEVLLQEIEDEEEENNMVGESIE